MTEQTFFDFAAEVGLTKHLGGAGATDELAEHCHITSESYVLDVGCGAGVTAVYLAKQYGCRVMGVDILPRMVARSRERAAKAGLTGQVMFRTADAQSLPFEDDLFDAVLTESVTVFPEDKQLAAQEYARVTKPGGFVGLNESTWLKFPPPPEVAAWTSQEVGATVNPLTGGEWRALLTAAGLEETFSRVSPIDIKDESKGIISRYGVGGLLKSMLRAFKLYLQSPDYRRFLKRTRQEGIQPENLTDYFGYGIYVARKPGR